MDNYIVINREKHATLLADHRVDPITKELLRVGDEVCVCAICKTVYSKHVWIGSKKGSCCDQKQTLKIIPEIQIIKFSKTPKKQTFKNAFIFFLLTSIVLSITSWVWYDIYIEEHKLKNRLYDQIYNFKKQIQIESVKNNELKNEIVAINEEITNLESDKRKLQNFVDIYHPIKITDISFKESDDDDYGERLDENAKYIYSKIYYNNLSNDSKEIELKIKIFNPNGILKKGASSPNGYTFTDTILVQGNYIDSKNETLIGWGNKMSTSYRVGTYKYEVWYNEHKLYASNFIINY